MNATVPDRPALCVDCEEKPARRLLGDRWVCEACNTEAALEADRARRGPEPPPERRAPDEKRWHVGTYSGFFRCVQTNPRGTQLQECGHRHHTREEAAAHAQGLNERQASWRPAAVYCAAHEEAHAWRYGANARFGPEAGRLECPTCETQRTLASMLGGLPNEGDALWERLNEWEQGFVVSVRAQILEGVVLTEKQAETIEKLYRQVWAEEEV
ncbi:MAG: hypothetical protein ABI629_08775 [bacterium]